MKESDKLTQQASQEENDSKAFGLYTKALRENRKESFEEKWLNELAKEYRVEIPSEGKYIIRTERLGVLEFYPKANKILIRKENKWIKPGLKWIIKNLLNQKG